MFNKRLIILLSSTIISLVLAVIGIEILLRIWKPPQITLRGERILLSKNQTIENTYTYASDKIKNRIYITKNSLGFRGPEPPIDFARRITILAIGGSTTECKFITEGKTWTDYIQNHLASSVPNLWVNNAGIDGHSTYGHIQLMKQYISQIRPKYVLFLVGINDMAIEDGRTFDKLQIREDKLRPKNGAWRSIKNQSMILAYFQFLFSKKGRHDVTKDSNWIVDYSRFDAERTPLTREDMAKNEPLLTAYRNRLKTLITLTRGYSITPILITQPAVYGSGIDAVTGLNLGELPVSDFTENGITRAGSDKWMLLQRYNDVTREIGREFNIPVIDLANEMPKGTRYYYDYVHFTEDGAQKVGEIITAHLALILK